jgi:hypothetical protein
MSIDGPQYLVIRVMCIAGAVAVNLLTRAKLDAAGFTEWRATARTLSWRDRWALYRTTSKGRPEPRPELAALAVQRGEITAAAVEQLGLSRRWRGLLLTLSITLLVGGIVDIANGQIWASATQFFASATLLASPWLERVGVARLHRGVEINRRWTQATPL